MNAKKKEMELNFFQLESYKFLWKFQIKSFDKMEVFFEAIVQWKFLAMMMALYDKYISIISYILKLSSNTHSINKEFDHLSIYDNS